MAETCSYCSGGDYINCVCSRNDRPERVDFELEIKSQSESTLADFLRFLSSWEIPVISISSDAGPMIQNKGSEAPTARQWADHKRVWFPRVQSTYVLSCTEEQEDGLRVWLKEDSTGKRFRLVT